MLYTPAYDSAMEEQVKKLTIFSALGFLAQAGPDGATTTQIAQAFSHPPSHHQRSNRASQIMRQLAAKSAAEHVGDEPSPLYRHTPVSRWRVTAAGIARYQAGSARRGLRDQARADRAETGEVRQNAAARREKAITAAREELVGVIASGRSLSVTRCWRARVIGKLRAAGCTLAETGELFGLQRERIRQIEAGQERPCACRACITGQDATAPPASGDPSGKPGTARTRHTRHY